MKRTNKKTAIYPLIIKKNQDKAKIASNGGVERAGFKPLRVNEGHMLSHRYSVLHLNIKKATQKVNR